MKQTINTLDTSTEETTNVVFNNSSVQVASNSSAVKRKQNKENESPAIATVSAIKRKNPSACRQILVSTPEKKMRHNHNTHQVAFELTFILIITFFFLFNLILYLYI